MLNVDAEINLTLRPDTDNPFLLGPFQPNSKEYTADSDSLKVIGEIPKDLHGIYVRNTHNQVHEPMGTYHPFDGDGMLHAMRFENGRAVYRNRFVRTTGFYAEQAAGRSLWPGLLQPHLGSLRGWGAMHSMKDNAGTDVICHAGKLLASMSQGSEPWRLDPITLETLGPDPAWTRKVPDGLSSHYKVDPETGEMMFFNYPEHWPYMHYGVIDRENRLVHYTAVELPGARWPHDLGITRNYTILHDLPLYFDPEGLKQGQHNLVFNRDQAARFGVIPRHGDGKTVRWFEASPCFILHLTNCYEEGDEVVMDGCIMPDFKKPPVGATENVYERIRANLDKHNNPTKMHRWRFNLKTGQTREQYLDDEITEFPVCSNDFVGRPYRYSYNVLYKKGDWLFSGLKRFDLQTGQTQRHEYGEGRYGSEPQVARRIGAKAEDDGYLITFVADMKENTSECLILDAANIDAAPVARILLPERISIGTHACWVEGERIHGERSVA
ncbi:carotenoid oxygenase family protein [Ferrovibrio sp.]|uniref:carotenoid oxygenase family protein n=1 Tax=Ferrovibrio sp. TaxID=1917215 RepID=UPI0025B88C29|nr:carotenoid oxygenase family protein [Ferrovibrio sp.]MBX3453725.1 carotenoid oxygenase family protein [Ferrovibrio sp.]